VAEDAGAETDARLTGAEAFGLAVEIDAVCIGAKPSMNACTGAETGAGLTVTGASGLAVVIDPDRVGAASSTDGLVLSQSWTRTPTASVARSVMGRMSVDFMVRAILPPTLPKES
jgi:hypothetical protein